MKCPRCGTPLIDGEPGCPVCRQSTSARLGRAFIRIILLLALILVGVSAWRYFHPTPAQVTTPFPSGLVISVIDVGQGDSILVQFPHGQVMLVDAGVPDQGTTVVGYLQSRHITHIDLLVATHPHEDHIGGMGDVLAAFTVSQVWDDGFVLGSRTQRDYLHNIQQRGIPLTVARAGMSREMDGARVDVLAPVTLLGNTDSDANNNSIVLRLSYGAVSALLTGDMEGAERDTVAHWPHSTMLKVAHHGSRTGTDASFLRTVSPALAVISCGAGNPYGHPHAETVDALRAAQVLMKNTRDDGTVVISTDGRTYAITSSKSTCSSPTTVVPPTPSAGTGQYIGNIHSKIFHRATCASLPREQNRVYFATREAALSQGYRPCPRCNP